jgi:phage terminase large subunit-like protein
MEQFKNRYCVGGIDLSQTTDLTSACLIIEENGELFVLSHFWLPSEKLSEAIARDGLPYDEYIQKGWLTIAGENFVDYHAVFEWFRSAVEDYQILPLKIGYDRYSSQYLIQDLEAYGFQTDDVFQGYNLTGVIYETEGTIKDGHIHVGDNDLLKIHLLDTALDADNRNGRVKICKVSPSAHIDGVAALLDAMCVRQKWYADIGDRLRNAA